MSSRVFQAKTGHTKKNPQLCGLSQREIQKGDDCYYLTCRGNNANPERQIFASKEDTDFETGFRVVPSGRTRKVAVGTRFEREVPIYQWEEKGPDGRWFVCEVWERMVLLEEAQKLGYRSPTTATGKTARTVARKGDRTLGHAHVVSATPTSPLHDVAAAVWLADKKDEMTREDAPPATEAIV